MSGPKSNRYELDQERLRRQKIAQRALDEKNLEIKRQRQKAEEISRHLTALARWKVARSRYDELQKKYPLETNKTLLPPPLHPPEDPNRLEIETNRIEEMTEVVEKQLVQQQISADISTLAILNYKIETISTDNPNIYCKTDLSVPDQPKNLSLRELEIYSQNIHHTLKNRQAFVEKWEQARASAALVTTLRSALTSPFQESIVTTQQTTQDSGNNLVEKQLKKALVPLEKFSPTDWPKGLLALVSTIRNQEDIAFADLLLMELRSRIQNFIQIQQKRDVHRQEAVDKLATLANTVQGKDLAMLESVKKELYRIIAGEGEMTDFLRQQISNLQEATERAFDLQIAGEVIKETLEELGYSVGESFSTLFVEGGLVHFQRPSWDHYHVRLRISPQDEELRMHLVKEDRPNFSGNEAEHDATMERIWCTQYDRLIQELWTKGVCMQPIRRIEPGMVPVPLFTTADTLSQVNGNRRPERVDYYRKQKQIP